MRRREDRIHKDQLTETPHADRFRDQSAAGAPEGQVRKANHVASTMSPGVDLDLVALDAK
jgi:hypothetical protein